MDKRRWSLAVVLLAVTANLAAALFAPGLLDSHLLRVVSMALTLLVCVPWFGTAPDRPRAIGRYVTMLLLATIGMGMMIMARHLIGIDHLTILICTTVLAAVAIGEVVGADRRA